MTQSETTDSQIIVLGFEGQLTAAAILRDIIKMQDDGLIELEDAVVASRGSGTDVEIQQTHSDSSKFALRGGGAGLLAGLLLGGPILGAAGGAAVGVLASALKDYGIDASAHRTREVNRSLLEEHNLVLCLASNHKEALQFEFSDLADRIYLLSEMVGQQVSVEDPIGGPVVEFEAAAREIDAFISEGLDKIVELAS